MAEKFTPYLAADYLRTAKDIEHYLEAAAAENDPRLTALALVNATKACARLAGSAKSAAADAHPAPEQRPSTEQNEVLLRKLDELIGATKTATIPVNLRWLDADQIGVMIGFSARTVIERLACRPDFPRPFRFKGTGNPRWKATEVAAWLERERDRNESRGRRRKNSS